MQGKFCWGIPIRIFWHETTDGPNAATKYRRHNGFDIPV